VSALRAAGCVYAEDEARILLGEAASGRDLRAMLSDRVAGVPLEHVVGWAEFAGLRIRVHPGVFVPRARTALLVRRALAHVAGRPDPEVLDLCCGTGAAGVVIRAARPDAVVTASDLDPVAAECARENLPGALVTTGDLYRPLPDRLRGRFDVIVANAPYVPSSEIDHMPQEARLHEALMALDGGDDGTSMQGRVAREAPLWLAPAGILIIETSRRQSELTRSLVAGTGLVADVVVDDELDATAVVGLRGH
jgi:release factor glutamine methyltransferase